MRRIAFLYGVACYAVFLATFLYAPGFLANRWVPKSIDSGPEGAFLESLLIDTLLFSLFGLLHSVMARPEFKARWARVVPQPVERSTYVLVSSLCLLFVFWQWRPLTGVVWEVEHPVGNGALLCLLFGGWLLVLYATCLIDHFDLFGLRQVFLYLRGVDHKGASFVTPALYRWMRHPIYLGWLIFFWATPVMTAGHLVFAGLATAYILAAIPLEERDLVATFGDAYRRYRDSTRALVPVPHLGAKTRAEATSSFERRHLRADSPAISAGSSERGASRSRDR